MNQSEVEDAIMAYMFTIRGGQVDQSKILKEFNSMDTDSLTIENAKKNLMKGDFLQQMSHLIALGVNANRYLTHQQRAADAENERIEREKANKRTEDIESLKGELLKINISLAKKQDSTFITPVISHIINGVVALAAVVSLLISYNGKSQIEQVQQQLKPLQQQIDLLKSRLDSLPVQNSYHKPTK